MYVSVFSLGTCQGPKRGFGGSDFDSFSDFGAGQRGNLNPEFPGLRAHKEGTPCAAKHRIQYLAAPLRVDFVGCDARPYILRPDQNTHPVAGRKTLIAIGDALPALAPHPSLNEFAAASTVVTVASSKFGAPKNAATTSEFGR